MTKVIVFTAFESVMVSNTLDEFVKLSQEEIKQSFETRLRCKYSEPFNPPGNADLFLLSSDAVQFFHKMLENPDVNINILTCLNLSEQYVKGVLSYQGFTEEELKRLTIVKTSNYEAAIINDLWTKQFTAKGITNIYTLNNSHKSGGADNRIFEIVHRLAAYEKQIEKDAYRHKVLMSVKTKREPSRETFTQPPFEQYDVSDAYAYDEREIEDFQWKQYMTDIASMTSENVETHPVESAAPGKVTVHMKQPLEQKQKAKKVEWETDKCGGVRERNEILPEHLFGDEDHSGEAVRVNEELKKFDPEDHESRDSQIRLYRKLNSVIKERHNQTMEYNVYNRKDKEKVKEDDQDEMRQFVLLSKKYTRKLKMKLKEYQQIKADIDSLKKEAGERIEKLIKILPDPSTKDTFRKHYQRELSMAELTDTQLELSHAQIKAYVDYLGQLLLKQEEDLERARLEEKASTPMERLKKEGQRHIDDLVILFEEPENRYAARQVYEAALKEKEGLSDLTQLEKHVKELKKTLEAKKAALNQAESAPKGVASKIGSFFSSFISPPAATDQSSTKKPPSNEFTKK
ncbi:MAG TPA: hypothetical protein VLI69_00110 [Gammaproteobacteria bacterium]|nr:hypothetical protein [Gammaproteobacteria bacterium]